MLNKKKFFVRYSYVEGDSVVLEDNRCGAGCCTCFWTKEKASQLRPKKFYEIKTIHHFGGGCPSRIITLVGVEGKFPANWFKPFRKI